MTVVQALWFGVLQGLTEFLPVSSSGHLILARHLWGVQTPGLTLEIFLHVGTLLAVLLAYRRDLAALLHGVVSGGEGRRQAGFLFLAMLPTGVLAMAASILAPDLLAQPATVAIGFLITAGLLLLAPRPRNTRPMTGTDALWVGLLQGVAVVPGISRSGATVTAGLWRNLGPEEAARFSFLLAIPAILGAMLLDLPHAFAGGQPLLRSPALWAGMATAFATGYVCLAGFLWLLKRGRLKWFGLYTGLLGLILLGFGGVL